MKWILPQGAPWSSVDHKLSGISAHDVPIEFAELCSNPKYIEIIIPVEAAADLFSYNDRLVVFLEHVIEKDDTRPVKFSLDPKSINELIEYIREKIYDNERNPTKVSLQTFLNWQKHLDVLKIIKYRADNKDKHEY